MNLPGDRTAQVFQVLRYVFWGKEEDALRDVSWEEVMQVAKEQAVAGLAFEALEHLYPKHLDKSLLFEWLALTEQIKLSNSILNEEIKEFVSFLQTQDISYKIIKGQVVGTCYPNPMLRQSGDVDFWVTASDFSKCEEHIGKSLGVVLQRNESEKHIEYKWRGIQYEMHSHLATFAIKRHQQYFDKLVEQDKGMTVRVGNVEVHTLSPTLNVLYIFMHLFHHLIHMGVGLRQLCDWMMWLHHYQDEIDRVALEEHLEQMKLMKPYCVLGAILVDDLGLPAKEFPFEILDKDRKRSRKVLKDIMELGNFGHNKEKVSKLGLLHSLYTGWRMCIQGMKYIDLAPKEIICRIPHTVMWYLKK